MTKIQAEEAIEIIMFVAMILLAVAVGTGIVRSICLVTGNVIIFLVGVIGFKIIDVIG